MMGDSARSERVAWWPAASWRRSRVEQKVEASRASVTAFIRRLGGPGAPVDDLTQEVLVRALESAQNRRRRSKVSTWLFGIAVNVCREHRRGAVREGTPLDDDVLLQIADPSADPARTFEMRAHRQALERALAGLGPLHREVLLMRDRAGVSYREIADALGVPVGTVRSRIHNATALLLSAVEEELS